MTDFKIVFFFRTIKIVNDSQAYEMVHNKWHNDLKKNVSFKQLSVPIDFKLNHLRKRQI